MWWAVLSAGYTIVTNKTLFLSKGTFKSFNTIQYNKCNDRRSMEADSRAAQVSQESFFKGELSFKGGAGI